MVEQVLEAPVQTLALDTGRIVQSLTGQYRTGRAPTGGATMQHEISGGEAMLDAPTQTLGLDTPPGTLDPGEATIGAPTQTLGLTTLPGGVGYTVWAIDGQQIGAKTGEVATHRTLTLSLRVDTDTLTSALRPLKSDEGQVDTLTTDDGGFTAVDRADGENTFALDPPLRRRPLRRIGDVHVARYEEDMVSQTVDEWDVELDLVRDATRTDAPSIDETNAADEWLFGTRYGDIVPFSVDAEFLGRGEGGIERFEVTARLTFEQAHVWEAALNNVGGTRIREIPDATNVVVDDTGGDMTVDVVSPAADAVVADGEYVVLEWESERMNDAYQNLTATIAAK